MIGDSYRPGSGEPRGRVTEQFDTMVWSFLSTLFGLKTENQTPTEALLALACVMIHPRILVMGVLKHVTHVSPRLARILERWALDPTRDNSDVILHASNGSALWLAAQACVDAQLENTDTPRELRLCARYSHVYATKRQTTNHNQLFNAVRYLHEELELKSSLDAEQRSYVAVEQLVPLPTAVLACAAAGFFESNSYVSAQPIGADPWLFFVAQYCNQADFYVWDQESDDSLPWDLHLESTARHAPAIKQLSEEMARKGRWVSRVLEPYWEAIRRGEL